MSMQLFNASTPGQSLTQPVGGSPWEQPAQFNTPSDALEYLFDKLTEPRAATQMIILLKKGVPVEYVAKTMIFEGFSKGKWTPDVGMLMLKLLMAMIIAIAIKKGVKPKVFTPDKQYNNFIDDMMDVPDDPSTELKVSQDKGILPEFTGLLGAK